MEAKGSVFLFLAKAQIIPLKHGTYNLSNKVSFPWEVDEFCHTNTQKSPEQLN